MSPANIPPNGGALRLHSIEHVAFEDAAGIAAWARARGHSVTATRLFEGAPLPDLDSFDWLLLMGGPMNIYEHEAYPWLVREKQFLREALARKKKIVGVCLGAQLLADALGGPVIRNARKEIGWYPVRLTAAGRRHACFAGFPETFECFHWHGDTFAMPPGTEPLLESEACAHQAFLFGRHALGLQCHLEYTEDSIQAMVEHCAAELQEKGTYIQNIEEIFARRELAPVANAHLERLLDVFAAGG